MESEMKAEPVHKHKIRLKNMSQANIDKILSLRKNGMSIRKIAAQVIGLLKDKTPKQISPSGVFKIVKRETQNAAKAQKPQ